MDLTNLLKLSLRLTSLQTLQSRGLSLSRSRSNPAVRRDSYPYNSPPLELVENGTEPLL